jgi:hypothetical protein
VQTIQKRSFQDLNLWPLDEGCTESSLFSIRKRLFKNMCFLFTQKLEIFFFNVPVIFLDY